MGSSIAALTAFAVLGARNLGFGSFGVAAWIGPTVLLVPMSILTVDTTDESSGWMRGSRNASVQRLVI